MVHVPGLGSHRLTPAPPQTHRLKEGVAPVLSVLTECARLHRPARKFLKAQVWQLPGGPWSPRPAGQADRCSPRCCPR